MRVGRAALDEDAIRLIEEHNPEVDFDWTLILKGNESAEQKPQPAVQPPPQHGRRQHPAREARPGIPPARTAQPSEREPEPGLVSSPAAVPAVVEIEDEADPTFAGGEPVPIGRTDDLDLQVEESESSVTPAAARLGSEGLLRLRARYAEVLARISQRVSDPVKQEELKAQAERLNPDAWVTAAEVSSGLEQYEAVYDALQAVVGRKGKRRRRRRFGAAQPAGTGEIAGAREPGGAGEPEGAEEPPDTEENDGEHE